MAITRWNPWVFPRWIDEDETEMFLNTEDGALDLYEEDDNVVVKMKAPGFAKEDLNITVVGDNLTIKADKKEDKEEKGKGKKYYRKEIREQSLARSVTLPSSVKSADAKASFKDGILTLTLPKAEEAKPKAIQIN